MKKFFAVTLIILMSLAIISCGGPDKDTLSSKNVKVSAISFEPPEKFKQDDSNSDKWFAPDYPTDSSYIITTNTSKDKTFNDYTEDQFKDSYELAFKNQGFDVQVKIDDFEFITIDGFNAVRIESSYTLSGQQFKQVQYCIDADKSYAFVLFNGSGADWIDDFDKTVQAIKIKYKEI